MSAAQQLHRGSSKLMCIVNDTYVIRPNEGGSLPLCATENGFHQVAQNSIGAAAACYSLAEAVRSEPETGPCGRNPKKLKFRFFVAQGVKHAGKKIDYATLQLRIMG